MLEELFQAVKEDAPALIRKLVAAKQVDITLVSGKSGGF